MFSGQTHDLVQIYLTFQVFKTSGESCGEQGPGGGLLTASYPPYLLGSNK